MSDELREAVAATARAVVAAGLIGAFGHVSARRPDGVIVITPTTPLAGVEAGQVIEVAPDGRILGPGDAAVPLELPLHLALYAARPDVGAICRGHGPALVAWGAGRDSLPLLHGLGALAGRRVAVHPDPELVTTLAAGEAVAVTLGPDQAVLLQANGGLAVGVDLVEAATRLWYLEERAAVALAAPSPGSIEAAVWDRRLAHSAAELSRACSWFAATFISPSDPSPTPPRTAS